MEVFFNTFLGKIIRWILLLPIAIIAMLVVHFIVGIFMFLSGMAWYESYWDVILRVIFAGGASGYAFIIAGAFIAPHFKKFIAGILGALIMLMCLLGLLGLGWSGYMDYTIFGKFESWTDILSIISTGAGVFFAIANVFEDEENLF